MYPHASGAPSLTQQQASISSKKTCSVCSTWISWYWTQTTGRTWCDLSHSLFSLGCTNSRSKEKERISLPLCWFFHWPECFSRIQLLPLARSKWFIHYTQWRYVLRKAGPSWSIFADLGSWRISRAVDDKHTPWIISIYQTTFWCEDCPSHFPTNRGYAAFGYPRHSSLSRRRDNCWSFNAWARRKNWKRLTKNVGTWVQTSARKVLIPLNIHQVSWFHFQCWWSSSGCRKYPKYTPDAQTNWLRNSAKFPWTD